jgi:flavin-dependent dehydrogenase
MASTMRGSSLGPLPDGGRVVIIGGGPAGTATAIALQQGAQALGRCLQITVVEGKRFAGEQHHNQCAGVLSPPIVELLQDKLAVPFPHHLIRRIITGYVLHTSHRQLILDGEAEPSIALRRIQFDAYMLDMTRQRGVEVLSARATGLEFHADRVIIYTESTPLEADVVVGAFGLDEGTAALFQHAVGYRPPPALSSIVTKYHPGEAGIAEFGGRIHAFLPATPRIEFGAITPKGNHLTINIAGATVDANLMTTFLSLPEVRRVLPCLENVGRTHLNDFRYFKGRFPCGLGRNFAGDRFVIVGDAAGLVRAFKGKGVTSAIQTGIRAAEVILHRGISASAFQAYHAANRDLTEDLPYGQAMRQFAIFAARIGLMDVILQAAERDTGLHRALFDAVSAHRPYRDVIRQAVAPTSAWAIVRALVRRMPFSRPDQGPL